MKGIFAILGSIGAGAALMYLFDPKDGNRRRSLIKDKATSINSKAQTAVTGKVKDLSNRAKGLLHESKSVFKGSGEATSEETYQDGGSFTNRESYNQ